MLNDGNDTILKMTAELTLSEVTNPDNRKGKFKYILLQSDGSIFSDFFLWMTMMMMTTTYYLY